jgi:hypothetical protein
MFSLDHSSQTLTTKLTTKATPSMRKPDRIVTTSRNVAAVMVQVQWIYSDLRQPMPPNNEKCGTTRMNEKKIVMGGLENLEF